MPSLLATLTTLTLLTLPLTTTAHFSLSYPPSRAGSSTDSDRSPCGGAGPSSTRTPWPLSGGRISFEAGHDEAITDVRLYLGETPPERNEDFNITLVPEFNQIGLGVFCWEKVATGPGLGMGMGKVKVGNGTRATMQVRQFGEEQTWLYSCADIILVDNAPSPSGGCANDTGITAEPISGDAPTDTGSNNNNNNNSGAAGGVGAKVGGVLGAVVVAVVMVGMM